MVSSKCPEDSQQYNLTENNNTDTVFLPKNIHWSLQVMSTVTQMSFQYKPDCRWSTRRQQTSFCKTPEWLYKLEKVIRASIDVGRE